MGSLSALPQSMAEVVRDMAQLSDTDQAAMAEYLKSLPAVATPPRPQGK